MSGNILEIQTSHLQENVTKIKYTWTWNGKTGTQRMKRRFSNHTSTPNVT